MPLSTQVKLLRVLESGEIVRVGTNEPIKVNVRLISATNRDLTEAIASEAISARTSTTASRSSASSCPPLRERREDIDLLIDHFLKEFTASHDKKITLDHPRRAEGPAPYTWPGNVRELRNVIESMVVIDSDGVLDVDDLTEDLQAVVSSSAAERQVRPGRSPGRQAPRGDREALHHRDPQAHRRQPRGSRADARHRRAHALPQDQGIRRRLSNHCQGID